MVGEKVAYGPGTSLLRGKPGGDVAPPSAEATVGPGVPTSCDPPAATAYRDPYGRPTDPPVPAAHFTESGSSRGTASVAAAMSTAVPAAATKTHPEAWITVAGSPSPPPARMRLVAMAP